MVEHDLRCSSKHICCMIQIWDMAKIMGYVIVKVLYKQLMLHMPRYAKKKKKIIQHYEYKIYHHYEC